MFKYIIKRILYFIPTFFIISLLSFTLGQLAPGDPVELKLKGGATGSEAGQINEKLSGEKQYMEISEKLGRNLPVFYFSISSKAYPDTLYRIARATERENLDRLINMYGNWPQISHYYSSIKKVEYGLFNVKRVSEDPTQYERMKSIREACNNLYHTYKNSEVQILLDQIKAASNQVATYSIDSSNKASANNLASVTPLTNELLASYDAMKNEATPNLNKIPSFQWYGLRNQYHRWMFGDIPWFGQNDDPTRTSKGLLRFDFGTSYLDGRPVSQKIKDALPWTLLLNFITFLIIYLIGIPMGVSLAVHKGKLWDRAVTTINFILYSLPTFWIATMAITFLTNDHYASILNIFPSHGVGKTGDEFSFLARFSDRMYHFSLPIFCILLGAFAYLSKQMRGGMLNVLRQDYIRTAFAKGLSDREVFWKHAFRNSLIPIITMIAGFLPAMISGSVIIEYIFTIPGMGQVSYLSVTARDFPVLFTILMASAVLTMMGNLVADIMYGFVDPRISFTKKM